MFVFDYSTNKVITHEEKKYCSSAIDILYDRGDRRRGRGTHVVFDYSTNKVITHEEKKYCSSAIVYCTLYDRGHMRRGRGNHVVFALLLPSF